VFCYVSLQDAKDTIVPDARASVVFGTTGDVQLVGENPATAEAGIATILLESEQARSQGAVFAIALVKEADQLKVLSAAVSARHSRVPSYVIRYTTDGSEPTEKSPVYSGPISNPGQIKAAVFVKGISIATAIFPQ